MTRPPTVLPRTTLLALLAAFACGAPLHAQPAPGADERPAFSLASGTIYTTRDTPAIDLTFRRVERLEFRVYKVRDPFTFLAGLRDPHQLGSEEPWVDQEPTRLERLALWKARQRERVRSFFRRQFSREYRAARRERRDREAVQLRRTEQVNTFAQVPLLNPSQLVTAWREILPRVRDAEVRRIPLDLREPGLYVVEAVSAPLRAYTLVIVSDVGLVSKAAPGQVLLFAANRFSGAPVADCAIRVLSDRQEIAAGTTSADGVFTARLEEREAESMVSMARCGDQITAADPGAWYLRESTRDLVGYVYTDKPIYRPGHTLHLKGVLRWRVRGAIVPFDAKDVEVRVSDPLDKVIFRARRTVDGFGAVSADVPIPAGAALGRYTIGIVHGDSTATGSVEVQEYRRPEFEVRVVPAERFVVQGGSARVTVDARYYFGQPVAAGRVTYVVHRQPYYSPLRWSDDGPDEDASGGWWYGGDQTIEGTARLDENGQVELRIPTEVSADGRDVSLRIEARVTDASSREVSGDATVHSTYGPFLVAASTDRYVAPPGTPVTLTVRAVDYQGQPRKRRFTVRLERRIGGYGWGDSGQIEVVQEGTIAGDDEGRATWSIAAPAVGGDYRFRASTMVDGRAIVGHAYLWVPGTTTTTDSGWMGDRYLELIPERRTYRPGETARFLVRGEEFETHVLVTKEAQDISYHRVVRARANESIEVPIGDDDVGDTWINIAFLKDDRMFRAERRITVPADAKRLDVTVTPERPVARPQEPARFVVRATDADGRPVRAQLSLGVIDEAVYGVRPDTTTDPLRFFYRREYSRVGTTFSRYYSFIGYSGTEELRLAQRRRPLGLADFKADAPAQPQVRKEFPDAIYWIADLETNEAGEARVELRYPDALTTWRLTARAVTADTRVGSTVARTTTTKDLIVRAVTPRFLSQGDEVAVPVITHSYLPGEAPLSVTVEAEGLTPVAGPDGAAAGDRQAFALAPRTERRLDWRYRADRVGTATVTARAVTPGDGDAVQISLPVLPFGLKREASQAGSIVGGGERSVVLAVPAASNADGRRIEVSLAPSLAGSLLGALDFLTSYPYGCTEQTVSSFLPTLLVARAFDELKLEPTERLSALDRQVTAGIRRLTDYQSDEGGWGWWRSDAEHPFMTAYAVFALLETKARGYPVDEWRLRRGVSALARLHRAYPRATPALKAYVVYVLGRATAAGLAPPGEGEDAYDARAAMDDVWAARERLTPYGRALLLQALDAAGDGRGDALARDLLAEARRTGDLAWWATDHDPLLDDWADTSVEATAMAVQALVRREPANPVLEAAVRYLLASRQSGVAWLSTKQTAMVLYGLLDYMKARGETAGPVTAEVRVNGAAVRTIAFTAADLTAPDPVLVEAPAVEGDNQVTVVARGGGALYWSATLRYFATGGPIERTGSRRLAVVREYAALAPETVRDRIVYRERPFEGTAAPGDLLLVKITIAGASDWRYLLVEDPLPAGAEPIAEDDLYPLERPRHRWWGERREFRDDRAVFFQDGLPDGRVEFWYLLKVVTPGVFRAMPAQVTPMYVPGVAASTTVQPLTVAAPDGGAR